ncbi:MAG: AIR synthase-related protein [Alphaproteobacteria bacterium]|nr:AIR synthase-related protein [Alphaproteobacteria bacterium]
MGNIKKSPNFNFTEQKIIEGAHSNHCAHLDFNGPLEFDAANAPEFIRKAFHIYASQREFVHGENVENKPVTLMDIATIGVREQKKLGNVPNLVDNTVDSNAATFMVEHDGKKYVIFMKNETHNSPTEIVPYDGAATCIGGAIRDLITSGGLPFTVMRITGAGDPTDKNTRPGKHPQEYITTRAAAGFADYLDGVGMTMNYGKEYYHPGFVAKRLECGFGASVAGQGKMNIKEPVPGNIVLLIGEATGRDGLGGAAGASKPQNKDSLSNNTGEVPVGNPDTKRRILALWNDPEFNFYYKCNDGGAAGISSMVLEIAKSLDIYLDRVPLKKGCEDMKAWEIATSESQERMAIVVNYFDYMRVLRLAAKYGLTAAHIADVTDTGFVNMYHKGELVASLSREYLNNPPIPSKRQVVVKEPNMTVNPFRGNRTTYLGDILCGTMESLENCSQQGLAQRYKQVDQYTAIEPYQGKTGKTPAQGAVRFIPIPGNDALVLITTHGYDPHVAQWSPYHGAVAARLQSMANIIALGGDWKDIFFTDQEYFATPNTPEKLGAPFAMLLGGNQVSHAFGRPSIGGKDSGSGNWEDIEVPPTFVSFASAPGYIKNIRPQAFQQPGSAVGLILVNQAIGLSSAGQTNQIKRKWDYFIKQRNAGNILSARALGPGGVIGEVINASLGNEIGLKLCHGCNDCSHLFTSDKFYGSLICEIKKGVELDRRFITPIGWTTDKPVIRYDRECVSLDNLVHLSERRLSSVFPVKTK